MDNVKCIKCEKQAKFESPADFCVFHWCMWWAGSDDGKIDIDMFLDGVYDSVDAKLMTNNDVISFVRQALNVDETKALQVIKDYNVSKSEEQS